VKGAMKPGEKKVGWVFRLKSEGKNASGKDEVVCRGHHAYLDARKLPGMLGSNLHETPR